MPEESKHLKYFKVENFKCFESFEMDDIGQFNLIVGDNNVGKTSLLEALLFDFNNEQTLFNFQSVFGSKNDMNVKDFNKEDGEFLKRLFFRFDLTNQIRLETREQQYDGLILNHKPSYSLKTPSEINEKEKSIIESKNYNMYGVPSYYFIEKSGEYSFPLPVNLKPAILIKEPPIVFSNELFSFGLKRNYNNIIVHDKIKRKAVTESIRDFVPKIENIIFSIDQTISIELKDERIPFPLTSFGDGTVKSFKINTEIIVNAFQRLMIDEIDAGIHYSRLKQFWKTILKSARENNVQLFMTTHSLECMKYFTEALNELGMEFQEQSRIVHLSKNKNGQVKSYNFTYDEFSSNLELENEMRR